MKNKRFYSTPAPYASFDYWANRRATFSAIRMDDGSVAVTCDNGSDPYVSIVVKPEDFTHFLDEMRRVMKRQ